jgi:flagellar motor switch protein FliM
MGQILSQSEVDSILSGLDLAPGLSDPPAASVESRSVGEAALYDFEHPEPLRRSQLDALRLASVSASQSLQTNLSRALQSTVAVKFLGVEQSTYRDYLTTAENPSCIAAFASNDSGGIWLLDVSRLLVFTFVDCMLGGQPSDTGAGAIPCRPCTEVETHLIERFLRAVVPDLAGHFTRRTSLRLMKLVSDVSALSEAESNESVALVSFEVLCGAKQGLMQLCIPWKQVARAQNSAEGVSDFRDAIQSGAVKIPVIAAAQIARLKLSTRDLSNLNPGDVLLTDVSSSNEITLEIDGCEIFRGNPGQCQNHKVIRLTSVVTRLPTTLNAADAAAD